MTAEEYLKQGRMLDQRIAYHLRKLEELRASVSSVSSLPLRPDKVQTSPTGDAPFVRALERIEELQERTDREIGMLIALKIQIDGVIRQLDREDYQLMLIYRYLEGMTWEEAADLLHAGVSTLKRWHRDALDRLVLPENPICVKDGPAWAETDRSGPGRAAPACDMV